MPSDGGQDERGAAGDRGAARGIEIDVRGSLPDLTHLSGDGRGTQYASVAESCLCRAVTVPDFDFDGAEVEGDDGSA